MFGWKLCSKFNISTVILILTNFAAFLDHMKQNADVSSNDGLLNLIFKLLKSTFSELLKAKKYVCFIEFLLQPEWQIADPISTFLFSVLVLITTLMILRDILLVLMEGISYLYLSKICSFSFYFLCLFLLVCWFDRLPLLSPKSDQKLLVLFSSPRHFLNQTVERGVTGGKGSGPGLRFGSVKIPFLY